MTVPKPSASSAAVNLLMIEADGYLPTASPALARGQTNQDFQLTKGTGPSGLLLSADGKFAEGAQVIYLGPGEQGGIGSSGALSVYDRSGNATTKTDTAGRFTFRPKLGEGEIFAATEDGFARIPATALAVSSRVTLKPWAHVRGRLIQNGKPLAKENVDLRIEREVRGRTPFLNLSGTRTDEEGRFVFDYVPSGRMQLGTRKMLDSGHAWVVENQKSFEVSAGENLDIGTVEKTSSPTRAGSFQSLPQSSK